MSVQTCNNFSQQAIQTYLDDLLIDERQSEPSPTLVSSGAADATAGRYHAFAMHGLQLLIPETAIANIEKESAPAITSPCDDGWLAGYSQTPAGLLPVVDAPKLLGMEGSALTDGRPAVVISLNTSSGLVAVPAAGSIMVVDPEEVTWRGSRGRRPWLAGTHGGSRGVLLDVDGLCTMLATEDSNHETNNH